MRNFFYAMVLVSIVIVGIYISPKSFALGDVEEAADPNLPYKVIEIKPSGEQNTFAGASSNFELTKIISDLNIPYYPEDKLSAFPDPKLGIGSTIKLRRAPAVTIKDGKKINVYRSWVGSVGELLAEKNIELGVDDKISSDLNVQIFDGSSIVITRVAITTIIEQRPIDFQIVTKKNSVEERDYKKIVQAGKKGIKNYYYLVTREDGVEVSRVLQKTEIATPPVDQIVEVGTIVKTYGSGTATWYNRSKTRVAASNSVPAGTMVNVVNIANGKSVVVTVDDHGIRSGAMIDLSSDAFAVIGSLSAGVINVRVEKYYP